MSKRTDELSVLRPGIALRSIYLSTRYRPSGPGRFPIRAARNARMNIAKDATLKLGGRLILGLNPELGPGEETDFAPESDQAAVITLRPGASLETEGWVMVSPGSQVIVAPGGKVTLGKGHYNSVGSQIICKSSVTIGGDGGLSWGVLVMDSNFHPIFAGDDALDIDAPVTIGEHVWVGARTVVLKGATIGSGSIIAANSVVSGEIPPNVIAGGVPAKVLKERARWEWE